MIELDLTLAADGGDRTLTLAIGELVIAGWTARNIEAMEAHIAELEALGIARPRSTPTYYRNGASLLTVADTIEVIGNTSSGEVEFVMFAHPDGLLVGLGSDHTDREAEKAGVTLSKQLCPKPVASGVWRYDDVKAHWDALILRSYAVDGAERVLYQEGPVTTMRDPMDLIGGYTGGGPAPAGLAMFCGTLAVHGGVRPAQRFEMELEDPVLGRRLTHGYNVRELPVAG